MPSRNRNKKKTFSKILENPPVDWAKKMQSEAQRKLAQDYGAHMISTPQNSSFNWNSFLHLP